MLLVWAMKFVMVICYLVCPRAAILVVRRKILIGFVSVAIIAWAVESKSEMRKLVC